MIAILRESVNGADKTGDLCKSPVLAASSALSTTCKKLGSDCPRGWRRVVGTNAPGQEELEVVVIVRHPGVARMAALQPVLWEARFPARTEIEHVQRLRPITL